jgi:hypothetical protein
MKRGEFFTRIFGGVVAAVTVAKGQGISMVAGPTTVTLPANNIYPIGTMIRIDEQWVRNSWQTIKSIDDGDGYGRINIWGHMPGALTNGDNSPAVDVRVPSGILQKIVDEHRVCFESESIDIRI